MGTHDPAPDTVRDGWRVRLRPLEAIILPPDELGHRSRVALLP